MPVRNVKKKREDKKNEREEKFSYLLFVLQYFFFFFQIVNLSFLYPEKIHRFIIRGNVRTEQREKEKWYARL